MYQARRFHAKSGSRAFSLGTHDRSEFRSILVHCRMVVCATDIRLRLTKYSEDPCQ